MLENLKKEVCEANKALLKFNLVILTFGNVSGIDRKGGLVVIKPSGVPYEKLTADDMVVVDLKGRVVDGKLKPSMDTLTHLELYKAWEKINGICHTHSPYATAFAQAEKPVPCLGTTHSDHFYGQIPLTRPLSIKEVEADYERNTGKLILECFEKIKPTTMKAVIVARHGPFSWGKDPMEAVENALLLEEVAKIAFFTILLNPKVRSVPKYLLDHHYLRKYGPKASYGQNGK